METSVGAHGGPDSSVRRPELSSAQTERRFAPFAARSGGSFEKDIPIAAYMATYSCYKRSNSALIFGKRIGN